MDGWRPAQWRRDPVFYAERHPLGRVLSPCAGHRGCHRCHLAPATATGITGVIPVDAGIGATWDTRTPAWAQ